MKLRFFKRPNIALEDDDEDESPPRRDTPPSKEEIRIRYPQAKMSKLLIPPWSYSSKPWQCTSGGAILELDITPHGLQSNVQKGGPALRAGKLVGIQMQESAQMVAWIKTDNPSIQKKRKTYDIISDRMTLSSHTDSVLGESIQIFITVAHYDDEYLDYLNNSESPAVNKDPSFLKINQFGPWNTLDSSHMRELGPLLLAISLRADHESKRFDIISKPLLVFKLFLPDDDAPDCRRLLFH
ncbi:uncharacterized protein BDV17DRAFT_291159 [Aspergillus undulatus]|uniref:uncharacterized protein n=1 Tax=Aspergillus undulatus TaxID=1810928 RepID=UPI003CCD8D28